MRQLAEGRHEVLDEKGQAEKVSLLQCVKNNEATMEITLLLIRYKSIRLKLTVHSATILKRVLAQSRTFANNLNF